MDMNTMSYTEQNPFNLLPTEMNKMIIDILKKDGSSRDLMNLSITMDVFGEILKPTENEWKFHAVLPFIINYLTGTQILNCRAVCKTWRKDVDNVLSNLDEWQPFCKEKSDISHSSEYNPLQIRRIKWTTFSRTESIHQYLTDMSTERMKVELVGGSLALREPTLLSNDSKPFWEKSMEMMSTKGYQIKHLLLQPTNIKPREFFDTLRKMLSCTPNLKTLQFDGYCTLNVVDYSTNQDEESSPKSLLQYMENNPLPKIDTLQTLELLLFSNHFPVQVFQEIITAICPLSLKSLKLSYYSGEPEIYNPFAWQNPLANLTELYLLNIKNEQELERVMESIDPRITKIEKLIVEFDDFLDDIDFDRLCIAINKLRMSLTVLAIKGMHKPDIDGIVHKPSLRCLDTPNLKNLELDGVIFDSFFDLTILSHSLEYLHITCTSTLPNVYCFLKWLSRYVVDRWPGFNKFWNEMEKLKVVKLNVYKEKVWINRCNEFSNIIFRNDSGYLWQNCYKTNTTK